MIYISFLQEQITYFVVNMLYATKGNITLKIVLDQGKVCILPVQGVEENSRLLTTIARNEELLAQIDLNTSEGINVWEQLLSYFSRKGWRIAEHQASQAGMPDAVDFIPREQ